MKLITFTYTKPDGAVSERFLHVTSSPSNKYSGTDLTPLDTESLQDYIGEALELEKKHIEEIKELQAKYDLKYNFRQFLESRMSNISGE